MSSVPLPNKSDTDRTSVDSISKQSGNGTEGTVDHLNEAPQTIDRLRSLRDHCIRKAGLALSTEQQICHLGEANGLCVAIEVLREGQPG